MRLARSVPGFYPLLALVTAKRIVVRGASMYPTLRTGERVLFDRLTYRDADPQPGDVVLARHPSRPGVRFIKRVSDLPSPANGRPVRRGGGVGDEGYSLLGDNPDRSTDSRQLGPFQRNDIVARAWWVYWPPDRVRRIHRP
jgi:signal peptidase I